MIRVSVWRSGEPKGRRGSLAGFVKNLDDLLKRGLLQALAVAAQGFAETNGGFLHALVRLLRTADQHEMLAARKPSMAILVVQSQSHKTDDLALPRMLFICHRRPHTSKP